MKTMASKGNLNNERLTNHSARKHMIQKLNDHEIPPTHIMQLSGHRNVQSITNYSSLNLNQQKKYVRHPEPSISNTDDHFNWCQERSKHE